MILSQKQIEEIAAAVTEDFNKFFFGTESEEVRMARATPIDQFARDYLGLQVSFARLSSDGSICGLTAYTDTEDIVEEKGVMMQLNVYLFMTLRQSKLSGSSTNRKSTPMKTSELQSDSDVLFQGKTVEFAPKIT